MPSIFGRNKSQQHPSSVGNSSDQSSSTVSSVNDPANQRYLQSQVEDQSRRPYPARSTSHRHSSTLSLERPPVNVAANVNTAEATPPIASQQQQQQQQQQQHTQPQPPPFQGDSRFLPPHPQDSPQAAQQYRSERDKDPKKSIRSRIFGSSHHAKDPLPPPENRDPSGKSVNRRSSLREPLQAGPRYQTPTEEQQQQQQQRLQPQNWAQRPQGSDTHLPASAELDENPYDPFLQKEEGSPQVPQKDSAYGQQQAFGQQYPPEQYRDPYRPTLSRVDTNPAKYSKPANPDHYSPEQHSGSSGNSQQPQPPYISYTQSGAHSPVAPGQQPYQAFHQQPPPPHTGQPPAYSTQQPENQQFQPPPGPPPQGFSEAQGLRRPSQQLQPVELGGSLQQSQLKEGQLLGRPTSAQQFNPPSPAGYPGYDPSTASQGSNTPSEEPGPMAPAQHRNNLRSGDLGSQKIPGPPTREGSLQAPPGGQGQGPISPGVQSFQTGVVPQQAQGQPYRGPGKPGEDNGRDTPPPGAAGGEMTEEEFATLRKDHDVLKEKYQKVKRYFFDQQNQVHQLQNTLANQRMSMSRTSLDDSEYATRFNRLDGLIAQLAHSIRKNWKAIPPWLQVSVNKEAVATGGKEMIIVGRSAISGMLHREFFEKYFHPDLEPGLSTQLKAIEQNLRRFSPPTHSQEEEEALSAKIINWKMATLDGLVETRNPRPENRQRLIEQLAEKMLGTLEMYIHESTAPELQGGVPMIVELAVGILAHLPMESREVVINYFEPGEPINPDLMKIEPALTPLTNPCTDEHGSAIVDLPPPDTSQLDDQRPEEKHRKGLLGGLMGKKPPPQSVGSKQQLGSGVSGGSQVSLNAPPGSSSGPKEEKVRLAAGLAVQIRGRSVLVKAPVYAL